MNKNKQSKLKNRGINNIKKSQLEVEYATRSELNIEASMRSKNDKTIYDYFENSKEVQLKQIQEIITKLKNLDDVTDLLNKLSELEFVIKNNDDKLTNLENTFSDQISTLENIIKEVYERVTNLEEVFHDEITRLENIKNELNKKLEEGDQKLIDKESELDKLREELGNADPNNIVLKFLNPPEFTITEIMIVKHFINNYLKDLVIKKMSARYPESEYGKDYTITLEGLEYYDVMQGKMVTVIVSAMPRGKLNGKTTFEIKVNYIYSISQWDFFLETYFQPAIPISLRNVPENRIINHNVPNEIAKTKPLKLLLNNKDFRELTFKIFAEMNAASYWTDFQRSWQYIINGYVGTGQSTIGGNTIINNINNLYYNTSGYHNNIYKLIEKHLNDSGIPCTVTKKWGNTTGGRTLHSLGNLTFEVPKFNLFDDKVIFTKSRYYYMMINFEINVNNYRKKFYQGVTLALTDNLELYPTI